MKRIDITEKLSFDGKPVLVIKDKEFEVNDDAVTILKIMDMMDDGSSEKDVVDAAKLLFGKGYNDLLAMGLNFADFMEVINQAMEAVTGENEPGGAGESWYSFTYDWDLIVSSISEQYGIRMYSKEFQEMKWDEFKAMLIGIGPDTALGRIVSIRAEEDEEVLKTYTKEMHQIRNEWRRRIAKERSQQETEAFIESMKRMLINMAK